jgi:hypothetical protein
MKITVITSDEAVLAALCQQRHAVISTDTTSIGTSGMFNCTGVLLIPASGSGPSAIAHIEARTDRAVYLRDIATAMGVILRQMKMQDAAGMALVLMGGGASAMGSDASGFAQNLTSLFTSLKIAEADILDLRSLSRYTIGSARLADESNAPRLTGCCVYHPETRTLALTSGGPRYDDSGALTEFVVQEPDSNEDGSSASGTGKAVKKKSGRCVIL